MYETLGQYAHAKRDEVENGEWNGRVPRKYETDDKNPLKLGGWVSKQRVAYENNNLSTEKVRLN